MNSQLNEQLPELVVNKILDGNSVRVAIAEHPVTKEPAPCVPIMDYAEVFSYDKKAIFQMVDRTAWLKKHSGVVIMLTPQGGYQPHRIIFEEAMLGIFMKLQPKRCKNPDVAAKVDELQEKMVYLLRDALRGYRASHGGFQSQDGKLPWPGLSMDAIATLCKQADRLLGGRTSLQALNYFTGMPVDDLLEEIELRERPAIKLAETLAAYLQTLLDDNPDAWGIEKGVTEDGNHYLQCETTNLYNAFTRLGRQHKLPPVFKSAIALGNLLGRETEALESLGWIRSLPRAVRGHRYYRYERVAVQ